MIYLTTFTYIEFDQAHLKLHDPEELCVYVYSRHASSSYYYFKFYIYYYYK